MKGTAFSKETDLLRDPLLLIHIDLTELDCAVRVQVREIFNDRGDEFAWSTPPRSRRRRLCPSGPDKRRLIHCRVRRHRSCRSETALRTIVWKSANDSIPLIVIPTLCLDECDESLVIEERRFDLHHLRLRCSFQSPPGLQCSPYIRLHNQICQQTVRLHAVLHHVPEYTTTSCHRVFFKRPMAPLVDAIADLNRLWKHCKGPRYTPYRDMSTSGAGRDAGVGTWARLSTWRQPSTTSPTRP